jgi:hypothetical protein
MTLKEMVKYVLSISLVVDKLLTIGKVLEGDKFKELKKIRMCLFQLNHSLSIV